jgi:F-type H+-transporting ATPase subunit b
MGINLPFLISQIVNFLILFGLLTILLWKPAKKRLDERREMLEQQRADAMRVAEQRANLEAERKEVLEEARKEADQIVEKAQKQVEAMKKYALQEERTIRKQAQEEAQEHKERVLKDIREQLAPLAIAAAQKLIGETLDENRQRELLAEFISGIKEGDVVVLQDQDFKGKSAEVTSALPLKDDEKQIIRDKLLAQLDDQAEVQFRVDPSILGGVIIKVGDKVFNNSVAGQLNEMRESLT